jgi:anti-anti-sigma factor
VDTETLWETVESVGRWTVEVTGELDLDTGPRLREYLAVRVAHCPGVLAVDLSRVGFCDSSGLQALVATLRRARLLNRQLVLVVEKESRVHRLLELAGVVDLFDLEFAG